MNAEHCPECDAVGTRCGCVPGFQPLRVRPYVALPDPGQETAPPPPLPPPPPYPGRAAETAPPYGTPASEAPTPPYGTPVVPLAEETMQLTAVPTHAPQGMQGTQGMQGMQDPRGARGTQAGHSTHEAYAASAAHAAPPAHMTHTTDTTHTTHDGYEATPPRRRIGVLPMAAASVAVIGAAALTLVVFSGSDEPGPALLDAKPSSPSSA